MPASHNRQIFTAIILAMKTVSPKLPNNLRIEGNLCALLTDEATISCVESIKQAIDSPKAKSISIKEAKFTNITIVNGNIRNCHLDDISIENSDFSAAKLPGMSARRVVFKSTRLSGVQLYESTLKDVTFIGCKLDLSNFRFAQLKNVLFEDCVISEADFAGAVFNNVVMSKCELEKTDFSNSKITSLDLRGSNILGIYGITSLEGAKITPTQLIGIAPQLAAEIGLVVEDS